MFDRVPSKPLKSEIFCLVTLTERYSRTLKLLDIKNVKSTSIAQMESLKGTVSNVMLKNYKKNYCR